MKKLVKRLAVLVVCLMTMTACSSGTEKGTVGTAKDGNEQKIETAAMKLLKTAEAGYKFVGTEELKKMVDAKEDMIIIDTMPASSFTKNHIPGAVNAELPVKLEDTKPEQKEAFLKALGTDKSKKVVIYCGFVGCERSHVGALVAKEAGFTNILRHPGGIIAWVDAGYPVEK